MAQQGVAKSVDEGVDTGVRTGLIRAITGGAEQEIVSAPVGGDFKGLTSLVIPATQVIAAAAVARIATCVITDDEGNVISNAYEYCVWSSSDVAKGTVTQKGIVTKIGNDDVIITAAALGGTDTCTVSIT